MNKYLDKTIIGTLGLLTAAGAVAMFGVPEVHAQDATITIPDRPCFRADSVNWDKFTIRPVIVDSEGAGWVVVHSNDPEQADDLGFVAEHEGEKFLCIIANGKPEKRT